MFKFFYFGALGLLIVALNGCYPSSGVLSQHQSADVRNARSGVSYSTPLEELPNVEPFPLKLDVDSVRYLSTYDTENDDISRSIRSLFQKSGDYPTMTFDVKMDNDTDTDTDIQVYGASHILSTIENVCKIRVIIASLDESQDIILEEQASGRCVSKHKQRVGSNFGAGTEVFKNTRARAYSQAAAKIISKLDQRRSEIDEIHANFILSQP